MLFGLGFFILFTPTAHANPTLTVNGGASVGVLNGTPITLQWYATGFADCNINNGVGALAPSDLPSGSRVIMPPANRQTTYVISCLGASSTDSATVSIVPTVNLSSDRSVVEIGSSDDAVYLSWSSTLATQCSDMTRVAAGGVVEYLPTSGNVSGSMFDRVQSTTTYAITCSNVVTGLSTTDSLVVGAVPGRSVTGAPGPTSSPPLISISADPNPALYNSGLGVWESRITLTTQGVDRCYRSASGSVPVTQWGRQWSSISNSELATREVFGITGTTTFAVRCTVIGTGASVYASTTVFISSSPMTPTLPPPSVRFTPAPPPSITVTNPLENEGQVVIGITTTNVNTCTFSATNPSGGRVFILGWNFPSQPKTFLAPSELTISTSTRFTVLCTRLSDGATAQAVADVVLLSVAPPPPPTVAVTASDASVTPLPGQVFMPVTITWSSTNTTWCSDRRAATPYGVSYSFTNNASPQGVETIMIATTTTFSVTCNRPADLLTATDQATVVYNGSGAAIAAAVVTAGQCYIDFPNGTARDIPDGYEADPVTGMCRLIESDLGITNFTVSGPDSWLYDSVSATYGNVVLRGLFTNGGPSTIVPGTPVSYQFSIDYDYDGTSFVADEVFPAEQFTAGLSLSYIATVVKRLDSVPLGTHRARLRLNLDPQTINEGPSSNLSDNTRYLTFTAGLVIGPASAPNISIQTDRSIVRVGEVVTVSWSAHYPTELRCDLFGPGINDNSFNTLSSAGGSDLSSPLKNTALFTINCLEPITGIIFSDNAGVEVVPLIEEI